MKTKSLILVMLLVFTLGVTGCGNNVIKTTQETQTESTTDEKDLVIYAVDVSVSLRAIDEYSLSNGGDTIMQSYAFGNDCKFYNSDNIEVDFNEFASTINQDYSSNNKMTKCLIVSNDKLVTEVYIVG